MKQNLRVYTYYTLDYILNILKMYSNIIKISFFFFGRPLTPRAIVPGHLAIMQYSKKAMLDLVSGGVHVRPHNLICHYSQALLY